MLVPEVQGQLGTGGGLARALQTRHEDDCRTPLGELQAGVLGSHQLDQLTVHGVHELIRGVHALHTLGPQGTGGDPLGELCGQLEVHVGLEQGRAHGGEPLFDILGGKLFPTPQAREGLGQALGEGFKHGSCG